MAKKLRPETYTANRIGDWIDNSALRELRRDEDALLREKEINVQKFLNNVELRLDLLSQELEFIKMLVARYKSDNLYR